MTGPAAPEDVAALRAAGLDPQRTERIGEGWTSVAYRAGDRARDYVVRALRPVAYEWGTAAHEREEPLLARLETRGLPVPRETRTLRDASGRMLGTVHRYVAGAPARGAELHGAAFRRFTVDVAAFLTALHRVPVEEGRAAGVPELDLGTEHYPRFVDAALQLLGPRSRAWLESLLETFLRDDGSAGAARVLIHGDISGDHFLVEPSGALRGVIDFTDAMIADPALDFAGLLNDRSWTFMRAVLSEYRGPAAGDPDLERRARFYIAAAPLYEVYYGDRVDGGRVRAHGLRRFAARAAAATRAAR